MKKSFVIILTSLLLALIACSTNTSLPVDNTGHEEEQAPEASPEEDTGEEVPAEVPAEDPEPTYPEGSDSATEYFIEDYKVVDQESFEGSLARVVYGPRSQTSGGTCSSSDGVNAVATYMSGGTQGEYSETTVTLSTEGYGNTRIFLCHKHDAFEPGDSVRFSYSVDGGDTMHHFLTVDSQAFECHMMYAADGQEIAESRGQCAIPQANFIRSDELVRMTLPLPKEVDNQPNVIIYIWSDTLSAGDYFWYDEIVIFGTPTMAEPVMRLKSGRSVTGEVSGYFETDIIMINIVEMEHPEYPGQACYFGYGTMDTARQTDIVESFLYRIVCGDEHGNYKTVEEFDFVTETNSFCSGQFLFSNRFFDSVFTVGGDIAGTDATEATEVLDGKGSRDINRFDISSGLFSRSFLMSAGRWYPTTVQMYNGDFWIMGGRTQFETEDEFGNKLPVTNYLLERITPNGDDPADAQITLVTSMQKLLMQAESEGLMLNTYLHAYPLANNTILIVGMGEGEWILDPYAQTIERLSVQIHDPKNGGFFRKPFGSYPSSAMVDSKVVLSGGVGYNNEVHKHTIVYDISDPENITAVHGPDMASARTFHSAAIAADGSVLLAGGSACYYSSSESACQVRTIERLDLESMTIETLADIPNDRQYHSQASVDRFGQLVIVGGDRDAQGFQAPLRNFGGNVFAPPYLFDKYTGERAKRPQVSTQKDYFTSGENFKISLEEFVQVKKVVAVQYSAGSHGFDNGQRAVSLEFSQNGNGLAVSMKQATPKLSDEYASMIVPNKWKIFVISSDGVPSEAIVVNVSTK